MIIVPLNVPDPAAPLPYLVFDFDSTFTQVEGLDELADIARRRE